MSGASDAVVAALKAEPPEDHSDKPMVRRLRESVLGDADRYEIVDGVVWDGVSIMDLDRFLRLALPDDVAGHHIVAYWGQFVEDLNN